MSLIRNHIKTITYNNNIKTLTKQGHNDAMDVDIPGNLDDNYDGITSGLLLSFLFHKSKEEEHGLLAKLFDLSLSLRVWLNVSGILLMNRSS